MTYRVRTRNRAVEAPANRPFLVLRRSEGERWVERREDAEWIDADQRQPYGGKGALPCRVSTCDAVIHASGLCMKHHKRFISNGDPLVYHEHVDARWELEWSRLDGLQVRDLVVIEASEPDNNEVCELADGTPLTTNLAWLIGAVAGDGHLTDDSIMLAVHGTVRERAIAVMKAWTGKERIYANDSTLILNSRRHRQLLQDMGLRVLAPYKRVPSDVWSWPRKRQRAFLDGFCDADGHRPGDPNRYGERVYRSASRQLLAEVRLLHIAHGDRVGNLGVADHRLKPITIARNPPVIDAKPLWSFAVYPDDQIYARPRTDRRAGVRNAQQSWGGLFRVQPILAIDEVEVTDTYDIEVGGEHGFIADGVVVHTGQCTR
jgi:hypothetical protein